MDSFNFGSLRQYIPTELPWTSHTSMNPDDEDDLQVDDAQERQSDTFTLTMTEPAPIADGPKSNLDLVAECDNFPYYQTNPKLFLAHVNYYYGLYVDAYPDTKLGFVLPSIAKVLTGLPDWKLDENRRRLTLVGGSNEAERTAILAATTKAMQATNYFQVLSKWRNELYPVYGPQRELLFSVERAASPLFGIITYGCHMTAYTRMSASSGSDKSETKIWVARRAATKQTYGGMLDNTVAGGMATGESPLESMIRECAEEASLAEDVVRRGIKPVGTVTYFHIRDQRAGGETGLLQPECEYVYDLELPEGIVPAPCDDEVAGFELKTVEEVKEAMRNGEFKPNCAMVLLDFFVRHGFLTAENDEGYIEIVARLHRKFEFPTP